MGLSSKVFIRADACEKMGKAARKIQESQQTSREGREGWAERSQTDKQFKEDSARMPGSS